MQDKTICPYYAKNEDACDVGCGYITSHDAKMIIKFCSSQFDDCQKYRELSERSGLERKKVGSSASPLPASADSVLPLPVFGLFSLGYTTVTYALSQLPVFPISLQVLALVLFIGALGQIASGINALKKNPLRAVAFTGFGLFWLSLLALDILPRAGYGQIPGQFPMTGYFAMWGIFSLILCQGLESLSRTCRLVFAMLTSFLMFLAIGHGTGNTAALHGAAYVGLAGGLPGIFIGFRYCWQETIQVIQLEMTRSDKIR